jgi:hypothetical protein
MPPLDLSRLEILLSSLETLADQEKTLVRDNLWPEVEDVQQRMLVLVEALVPMVQEAQMRKALPKQLQQRIDAITQQQKQKQGSLDGQLKEMDSILKEARAARAKLNTLRPAYGRSSLNTSDHPRNSLDAKG